MSKALRRAVLLGLDLDVAAGALTVVRGRSGAGKSTLLRVLVGLERPDAGRVELGGVDLTGLDRAQAGNHECRQYRGHADKPQELINRKHRAHPPR